MKELGCHFYDFGKYPGINGSLQKIQPVWFSDPTSQQGLAAPVVGSVLLVSPVVE
jgi:hypothetical protein